MPQVPAPKSMTIAKLADTIRARYPGSEYGNKSNMELVGAWLKKYPAYQEYLDVPFPTKPLEATIAPSAGRIARNYLGGQAKSLAQGANDMLNPSPLATAIHPDNLKNELPPLAIPGAGIDTRPIAAIGKATVGAMQDENAASTAGYNKMVAPNDPGLSRVDNFANRVEGLGDWVAHSIGQIPFVGPAIGQAYDTAKTDPTRAAGQLILGILAPELAIRRAAAAGPIPGSLRNMNQAQREANRIEQLAKGVVEDIKGQTGTAPEEIASALDTAITKHMQENGMSAPFGTVPPPARKDFGGGISSSVVDPEAEKAFLKVAAANEKFQGDVVVKVIQQALKNNPDNAYKILMDRRMSRARLDEVKGLVGEDVYNGMRAQVINDLLRRTKNVELMDNGTLVRPEAYRTQLLNHLTSGVAAEKYGNILGRAEYNRLLEIAKISAAKNVKMNDWLPKIEKMAVQLITRHMWRKTMGNVAPFAMGSLLADAGQATIARIISRPEGGTVIREYVRAMGNGDEKRMAFYLNRVSDVMERELKRNPPQQNNNNTPPPPPPG
jgi:hypothetical protein